MTNEAEYEILSDGRTVWVNASNGSLVGRFGKNGIDIHSADTLVSGITCLFCTHGQTGREDWEIFVAKMKEFYSVEVSDEHRPRHL